jgi:hypothetical protein
MSRLPRDYLQRLATIASLLGILLLTDGLPHSATATTNYTELARCGRSHIRAALRPLAQRGTGLTDDEIEVGARQGCPPAEQEGCHIRESP